MKAVILAGGFGTRLAEETEIKPKPMVEIGGRPIIWHIMKHYAFFGVKDFFIALGYKGHVIKRYFLEQYAQSGTVTVDLQTGTTNTRAENQEDWLVHLVDTGLETQTGGRIGRLRDRVGADTFCATYGDGVGNVDVAKLIEFHKSHGRIATITAVRPPARFGGLRFDGPLVAEFTEKPQTGEGWINGGFFVFEPRIFDYLEHDGVSLEVDVLERLAQDGELAAYRHEAFWQCMDTLRDKRTLETMWREGTAPWQVWS